MKKQGGITLVALVITIIVLLILAGLSVMLGVGNNWILTQAISSVEKNKEATAKEEISLAWGNAYSEYLEAWTENLTENIDNYFTETNLNKYVEDTGTITNLVYNANGISTLTYTSKSDNSVYNMEIGSDGNISIVDEDA